MSKWRNWLTKREVNKAEFTIFAPYTLKNNSFLQFMSFSADSNVIFNRCIADYHVNDNVDTPINNPYEPSTIEGILYVKNWIDTVQWHLEDIIHFMQIIQIMFNPFNPA